MKRFLFVTMTLVTSCLLAQTPPIEPALFTDAGVNTSMQERDMAISPDGKEMFFTLQSGQGIFSTILHRKKMPDGKWSEINVAPFSGRFGDLEPAFSQDGKQLFFCSNRPLSGDKKKDYDIWVTERSGDKWSEPRNLGPTVNTSADEYYPSVGAGGNLYFTAEYKTGVGKVDIYVSKWSNGTYVTPEPLDTAVNSKNYEFNAFVSPDEKFIIFTSYGRKDDSGGGDLYISEKNAQGAWTAARNLSKLNSPRLDYCPFVSFDKKVLYFTSNRHALPNAYNAAQSYKQLAEKYQGVLNGGDNIYWVTIEALSLRP